MRAVPTLTVLICTHNRVELLTRVIDSLNGAKKPRGWDVRILVAANACSDGTHDFLDTYRKEPPALPLKWVAEPRPGKSHALNTAIGHVESSDIVTFVDDDHRVDENYLVAIAAASETYPDAAMFCGRILPDWNGQEPAWVHDEGPYKIRPLPIPRSDGGPQPRELTQDDPTPGGGNLFIRGHVFQRVGTFPTELGPHGHDLGGGEDSAFVQSALAMGERLMYVPEVLQYHYVDPDRLKFGYVLRKAFHRSRSAAAAATPANGVPLWMWRKLAVYFLNLLLPLDFARTRHTVVRIANTLGEMAGLSRAAKHLNPLNSARRRDRRFLAGITASVGTALVAGALQDPAGGGRIIASVLFASALLTLTVGIKSLIDFTQTGPKLPATIVASYRTYAVFALLRLLSFAFVLMAALAAPGVLVYYATSLVTGTDPTVPVGSLTGILSILLLCALQFSRHLLWLPANISASYSYRLSRLYPFWRQLTPAKLRFATLLLLGLPSLYLLAAAASLLAQGRGFEALVMVAMLLGYGLLGLWLLDRRGDPQISPSQPSHRPNIVMIGSDTLRSDRLDGSYPRKVAPFLDGLAQKGILFSHCYVPCARTAPSLLALLTGTWPHRLGVRDNFVADEETHLKTQTLPNLLRRHGYYTAALSDWCGADMRKFTIGFDYVDVPEDQWNIKFFMRQGPKDLRLLLSLFVRNCLGKRFLPEIYYLGGVPLNDALGKETRRLISHLGQQPQPFFLNVFLSTTHGPFGSEYPYYTRYSDAQYAGESKFVMARLTDPFEIIRRQGEPREEFDLDQIMNLYDGCVTRFDDEVKSIVDHLQRSGLADNTILVIYSDHGMELFEHGTWGQGNSVVGEVSNRIPLLIQAPRIKTGRTVTDPVRSVDLMPTLLELVGIAPPDGIDGVSLAPLLQDPQARPDQDVFSETGIWLTELPGTPKGHLRYPDLPDLLTIRNEVTGTISLKPEQVTPVIQAKDRMIRRGRWKLVYQPLQDGALLKLYDVATDPGCTTDLAAVHPAMVVELWPNLAAWMHSDALMSKAGFPTPAQPEQGRTDEIHQ